MQHINPERMKVALPEGYTPSRFTPPQRVRTASAVIEAGNVWTVAGRRDDLVAFANRVEAAHLAGGVR